MTQQTRVPSRASRTQEYDLEEDDAYYVQRQPTSSVRYQQPRQQVIQRGNKRIVIHNEPPPQRHLHWSFILGIGMLFMLALVGFRKLCAELVDKPPIRCNLWNATNYTIRSGRRTF